MPKKSRHKPPRNAIVLEDIVFKLGIREVKGIIHGQQGMAVFVCEEEGIAVPLDFNVPLERYEEEITADIRTFDKSLVFEPGVDDMVECCIDTDAGELDVDPVLLRNLFEGEKLRVVPQVITGMGYTFLSALAAVIFRILNFPIFPYLAIPFCLSVYGLVWSIRWYIQLNKSVVYDSRGNWVDLATGQTSLNGGTFRYQVEVEK